MHRAADAAAPADKAGQHVAFAIQCGERGRFVDLGAHAALHRDELVEREESLIVLFLASAREMAFDAELRLEIRDALGRAEGEHIRALAEAGDEDKVAGFGTLQRAREHEQRMRRAGLAAGRVHIVLHGVVAHPGLLGERGDDARQCARHAEGGDVCGFDVRVLQERRECLRHDLLVALVANPALLPGVIVGESVGAVMINEIDRARRLADELGDDVAAADKQRCGAVAHIHLQRARRLCLPLIGSDHQRRTGIRGLQRQRQRRRAGALRRGVIVRCRLAL